MANIWVTSDWHFNHQKNFILEPRGYYSTERMNEDLIARHNSIVKPDDDVYVLGDLMLGGSEKLQDGIECIKQMNGKLHVIRGNHDSDKKIIAYHELYPKIIEVENSKFLKYEKYHFYLSHFPSLCSNYDDDKPLKQKTINLCGHSHIKDPFGDLDKGLIYHCEVDAHNNMPVSLDQIIEDLKTQYKSIKAEEKEIIVPRCSKCVYDFISCRDNDKDGKCKTYKCNPSDGSYYG